MTKRMLIDATHEEETRVAVVEDNRLEDFDYESQFRKPLKGSIFLAKVTRVEPSLQAAFVNFGGNRHGFLPFSEIHPDYFRIPIADREALIAEQEAVMAEEEEELEEQDEALEGDATSKGSDHSEEEQSEDVTEESEEESIGNVVEDDATDEPNGNSIDDENSDEPNGNVATDGDKNSRHKGGRRGHRNARSKGAEKYDKRGNKGRRPSRNRFNLRRKYKIQEVIKRGQIMLVQVSKEERGNKGAAVGSYLSLPGRYCVLMPNSPRAGGVSRKIANFKDRNRMREIMKDLEVPKGMSVILRTAGLSRTKTEIKRDLDYLIKLWNNIRELTLNSSAPALVYEEADLIKRAVRDLYTRDVEEVLVSGEAGYKTAKNFMKMMIPSHVKRVKEYKEEDLPLFNRYRVESQIAEIGETQVTLPSGGYLVINPTEALVSIDVNSGKSTKERHIEETALRTNLEAAEEVARQMRLRDLGGLVVIDFIDMEDRRNNGKVERKMRDALSGDRARLQMGRISSFGLMELSRQRLSPSLTESQFETCKHCGGMGRTRTADATSIMVLRALEDEGIKNRAAQVMVHVSGEVALYILNHKRRNLARLEEHYGFEVLIRADDTVSASSFRVEVSRPLKEDQQSDGEEDSQEKPQEKPQEEENKSSSSRRRGRRGGRRRNNRHDDTQNDENQNAADNQEDQPQQESSESPKEEEAKENKDKKKRSPRKRSPKKDDKEQEAVKEAVEVSSEEEKSEKKAPAKKRKPAAKKAEEKADVKEKAEAVSEEKPKKKAEPANDSAQEEPPAVKDYERVNEAPKEKKKGWWNRLGD